MSRTFGVDTNHWEGKIDSQKMASMGVKFNIPKMSDFSSLTGKGFVDNQFVNTYSGNKLHGILVGGYHWLKPQFAWEKQAEFVIDLLKTYSLDIPIALDFEDSSGAGSTNYLYMAQAWLEKLEEIIKRPPILYTGAGFLMSFPRAKLGWMNKYPLWLAQYTWLGAPPSVPFPWDKWTFWQYTDNGDGRKYGADAIGLDLDYFNGSHEDLLAFCDKPVEIKPEKKTIFVATTTTPNANLNVRSGPDISYPVIGVLPNGSKIEVKTISANEVWYEIDDGNWVAGRYNRNVYINEG